MRRTLVESAQPMARINVTPIIDVALVLVIVLLITGPILSVADLGIQLPAARTRGAEDEDRITITMGCHGELAIDDEIIHAESIPEALGRRLAAADHDDVLVVVRADSAAPHDAVKNLLRALRSAGAGRLAIGTRQSGGELP